MYTPTINPECKALQDKDLIEATDISGEFIYHHPNGEDIELKINRNFLLCAHGVNRSPFYAIGIIEEDDYNSSNDELNKYLKEECPWYKMETDASRCDFPTTVNGEKDLLRIIGHINKVWRSQHPIKPKVFQQENSSALSFLKHD